MAIVSNAQLWDYLRETNPSFASHTAAATEALFTEKGYEQLKREDIAAIDEFFQLSLRVAFQKIDVSTARNPLEGDSGFVEVYDTPNGGYVQRIAVDSIKPVSPAYKGLSTGDSPDPFVVRKPSSNERFFAQNFDYQSFISVQEVMVKRIFLEEYGMSAYIAGIMQGLQNGYTIQRYENILECLNTAINSQDNPLQDSQQVVITSWTGSTDNLKSFVLLMKDIATAMEVSPQTDAFNANGFATSVRASDHVLLVRAGLKNQIEVELEVGAFNPDRLALPFEIKEVENFGGIYYQATVGGVDNVRVYPAVDQFGAKVDGKWVTTEGGSVDDAVTVSNLVAIDPNADVIAVIAQKGVVFENVQNAYSVRPIFNPRGLYTNYWADAANNAVCYDANYDLVTVKAIASSILPIGG